MNMSTVPRPGILSAILIGLFLDGASAYNETLIADNSSEILEVTTLKSSMSLDDFIFLSLIDYGKLVTFGKIHYKGRFQGHLWYEDKNGTKYTIYNPKPQEEVEKELEKKLLNNTDGEWICVAEVCLPPDLAKKRLEDLRARREGRLLASQVVPFSVMVSVFIVVAVCGIVGNMLIIVGILRSSSLRNSTSVLLSSLAASDILVLIFCLPMQVLKRFFATDNTLTIQVCKFMFLVKYFSVISSTSIMSAMAVERYIAVCHPLKAKSLCNVRNALKAVIVVWVVSLAICFPVTFITGSDDGQCRFLPTAYWQNITLYSVLFLAVFIIPLGFMGPLYSKVFYVLWKSGKESKILQSSQGNTKKAERQEVNTTRIRKKVIKMLLVLLVVFVLFWGPGVTLGLVHTLRFLMPGSQFIWTWYREVSTIFDSLGICNSGVNPIVYICMSKQFRLNLTMTCKGCWRKKDSAPKQISTLSAQTTTTVT